MTGVLFIINIPQKGHEINLKSKETTSKYSVDIDLKSTSNYDSLNSNTATLKLKTTDCKRLYKSKSETAINLSYDNKRLKWRQIKRAIQPKSCKLKISRPGDVLSFKSDTPMETILSEIVTRLDIKNVTWNPTKDGTFWQVIFSVSSDHLSEELLQVLKMNGIGSRNQSTISVIPCSLHYSHDCDNIEPAGNQEWRSNSDTIWSRLSSSIRSRNNLDRILQEVHSDAALTFDWIFLLVVAAFVAAVGLVENSTVMLVASMLISPLMGPITAGTLGTAMRDRTLQQMGVTHELLGLFLTLVIGFIFGLLICSIDERYIVGEWPTYEMMSRCDVRSLWTGVLIAVPSGAAVALAVLSKYTASFVGVAISASLLPPAVNAGLFWALSLVHYIYMDDNTRWTSVVNTSIYSSNQATELVVLGTVSLCLTLVNILCIFVAGVVVYKIKSVDPANRKYIPWLRENHSILQAIKSHGFKEEPCSLWNAYRNQSTNFIQSTGTDKKCDTDSGNDSQSIEPDSFTSIPKFNNSGYPSLKNGDVKLYSQATIEPSLNYTIDSNHGIVLNQKTFHV